jgi:hypothetical protein
MDLDGVKVPRESLPNDEKMEILLKEVLR